MSKSTDIPIILLAAGLSRRMRGRDKLLEEVDDQPLLRRQALMACAATSGPVFVTLPPAPHPRYETLRNLPVITVPVPNAQDGMSESLKAGLNVVPAETEAVMLLLADLPDLTVKDLARVASAVNASSDDLIWRGTTQNGVPGHPIVVSSALFGQLMQITGDTGGSEVMKANRKRTNFVALPGNRALCDLDTPEDWATWRSAKS